MFVFASKLTNFWFLKVYIATTISPYFSVAGSPLPFVGMSGHPICYELTKKKGYRVCIFYEVPLGELQVILVVHGRIVIKGRRYCSKFKEVLRLEVSGYILE
jgi:hypothetical protein